MEHLLKIIPQFYTEVSTGNKTFEIRKNDRGYQVGDTLLLCEWLPEHEIFTGNSIRKEVIYILHGHSFEGLDEHYVVMAIR